jgi:hypothetical protein
MNRKLSECKLVEFIQSAGDDHSLLASYVTDEETWCFQYDPQTKRQSMEWSLQSSPSTKNFYFKSQKTEMLVTVRDSFTKNLFHQVRQ